MNEVNHYKVILEMWKPVSHWARLNLHITKKRLLELIERRKSSKDEIFIDRYDLIEAIESEINSKEFQSSPTPAEWFVRFKVYEICDYIDFHWHLFDAKTVDRVKDFLPDIKRVENELKIKCSKFLHNHDELMQLGTQDYWEHPHIVFFYVYDSVRGLRTAIEMMAVDKEIELDEPDFGDDYRKIKFTIRKMAILRDLGIIDAIAKLSENKKKTIHALYDLGLLSEDDNRDSAIRSYTKVMSPTGRNSEELFNRVSRAYCRKIGLDIDVGG